MEGINYIGKLLQLQDDIRLEQLEEEIGHLLAFNPEKLTWLLYRIDVSEELLKQDLDNTIDPPEKVITRRLLERCQEILNTRKQFSQSDSPDWSFDV